MRRENALFIGFDILLILISAISIMEFYLPYPVAYNIPMLIAGIIGIVGGAVSATIIITNKLVLKKYNIFYITGIVISVVYYLLVTLAHIVVPFLAFSTVIVASDVIITWILVFLPTFAWILASFFVIRNIKERLVFILNCPTLYFFINLIMFFKSWDMDVAINGWF